MYPITVVNQHSPRAPDAMRIYIGRPSPLGNPFPVTQLRPREQAIQQFRELLEKDSRMSRKMHEELEWLARASLVQPLELQCYCAPLACHGDVIKQYIEAYRSR